MKIDSHTTAEEVNELTKKTFVEMCSSGERQEQGETISEGIKKIFNARGDGHKPNYDLDDDVMMRIMELQSFISSERGDISVEDLLKFLRNAMNYGDFQIWFLKNGGPQLSQNYVLKKFLSETSDAELLRLFDTTQNCDQNNIDSIRRNLHEAGDQAVEVTEASRKIAAKILVK